MVRQGKENLAAFVLSLKRDFTFLGKTKSIPISTSNYPFRMANRNENAKAHQPMKATEIF